MGVTNAFGYCKETLFKAKQKEKQKNVFNAL